MAFSLCPLLTQGAIHALELCGSDELKQAYLDKMIQGTWTGTMNLTEPQAGSDLALVRTKAERAGRRTTCISGQKIFITYGEHDLAENIVHLVLARTPDAPEGVKGISLFLVPKFLSSPTARSASATTRRCASIEHKLGIHASPTAVMVFDKDAVGYLVGEENKGLDLHVHHDERRALQRRAGGRGDRRARLPARAGLRARAACRARTWPKAAKTVPIIHHPDVRRMLMLMKSQTEAMRALAYVVAAAMDFAHKTGDEREAPGVRRPDDPGGEGLVHRDRHRGRLARRAGARRHGLHRGDRRRAAPARRAHHHHLRRHHRHPGRCDLVGRKIAREGGATAKAWIAEAEEARCRSSRDYPVDQAEALAAGVQAVADCVDFIVANAGKDVKGVFAGAVPFLKLMGIVAGGWQMARAALAAEKSMGAGDKSFLQAKIITARSTPSTCWCRRRRCATPSSRAPAT